MLLLPGARGRRALGREAPGWGRLRKSADPEHGCRPESPAAVRPAVAAEDGWRPPEFPVSDKPGAKPGARCPSGEFRAGEHASAGVLTTRSGVSPEAALERLGKARIVKTTKSSATAKVDGRRLPAETTAVLDLSLICGSPTEVRRRASDQKSAVTVIGSARDGKLRAGPRSAIMYAGLGKKTLMGGPKPDRMFAGPGRSRLIARGDSDVLTGGPGENKLIASPSEGVRTMLVAGPGTNKLVAGPGLNYIDSRQGKGPNTIRCNGETVVMARKTDNITGKCAKIMYR